MVATSAIKICSLVLVSAIAAAAVLGLRSASATTADRHAGQIAPQARHVARPLLPMVYEFAPGAVEPFGTVGPEAIGSCPWSVKVRAACGLDRGNRRVLFSVGTGDVPAQSPVIGVDGAGRVYLYEGLASQPGKVIDCTTPHEFVLSYRGGGLELAVDGETILAEPRRVVPLQVPAGAPMTVGGKSDGGDSDGTWTVEVLSVDMAPCRNPLELPHAAFPLRVAAARAAWAAAMMEDPLEGTPHRALVDSICMPLEDAEERWMCRRRGRRMADRFEKYWYSTARNVNRESAMLYLNRTVMPGGILFSVVDGTVTSFTQWGDVEAMTQSGYPELILPWVADLVRGGALKPGMTFDFNVAYGDACPGGNHPSNEIYPFTMYSNSDGICPETEPLDWLFMIQDLGYFAPKPVVPWEDLKAKMIWKGALWHYARLQIADVALDVPEMRGSGVTDIDPYQPALELCGGKDHQGTHEESGLLKLRHPRKKVCGLTKRVNWAAQQNNKYQLLVDGIGTSVRGLDMIRGPGVNFVVRPRSYRMMWEHDYMPYVHYIPVDTDNLQDDLQAKINWAKAHDSISAEIAEASRAWAAKHASLAALQRMWHLYFVFMDDLWRMKNGGRAPQPQLLQTTVPGGLQCKNVQTYLRPGQVKGVNKLGCG